MLYKLDLQKKHCAEILGRTNENPPWRHGGRAVPYNHLCLVVSGSCNCRIGDRSFDAVVGDLVFIPSDTYYKITTSNHCEYYFACFAGEHEHASEADQRKCLGKMPEMPKKFYIPAMPEKKICIAEHIKLGKTAKARMLTLFNRCHELFASGIYVDRLKADAFFDELLICASEAACGEAFSGAAPLSLDRMTAYVNENFSEKITLDSLSARFGLSKEHICSLFRNEFGMSVGGYINSVKLDRAMELLSNSSMNVSQIADYLNYSSVYYFSRLFKTRFGFSPSHYKI